LYLYHLVAVFLVVTAFRGLHLHPEPLNLGVYAAEFCLSLAAAIALSSLSYRFFESPFLSLKDRRFGSPASA
jgi:peptidoglycan/LPS O-acetylase OafA/YrhL